MKQYHVAFIARRGHDLPRPPVTITVSVRGKPTVREVEEKATRALLKQFPDTVRAQWASRDELCNEISAHGYTIEWREYCEDGETPGMLGQFAGVTIRDRRAVKIGTKGRSEAAIVAILAHELEHVRGVEWATDYPEHGLKCGGTLRSGVSAARTKKKPHGNLGKRRGPREGSLNDWLSTFAIGEVRYREYDFGDERAMTALRTLGVHTRYPDAMKGWLFQGRRFLAIGAADPLAPMILLRVERKR